MEDAPELFQDGAESAAGTEVPDIADPLADVPLHRIEEVEAILDELQRGAGNVGEVGDLRHWLHLLNHITGFSREATVQLCQTMARCLAAYRPPNGLASSTGDLQQAFVRMGGVRGVVDALMTRRQDGQVVAECFHVLSTVCQGSPMAAESLQNERNTIRLLLRTIEQHASNAAVVEAGCGLVGHLCAPLQEQGQQEQRLAAGGSSASAVAISARCHAHRKCQQALVEAGAVDLLVGILGEKLQQVARLAGRAQELQAKAVGARKEVPRRRQQEADAAKSKVQMVKLGMDVRQAWEEYHREEARAAQLEEVLMHTLILIAANNEHTTRMVAGALWCWQCRSRQGGTVAAEGRPSSGSSGSSGTLASGTASAASRSRSGSVASGAARSNATSKSRASRASSKRTAKSSGTVKPSSEASVSVAPSRAVVGNAEKVDLVGEARQSSATLESFASSVAFIADILASPTARDRPALAVRACQLLALLASHQQRLLERLVLESTMHVKQLEAKFRCSTAELKAAEDLEAAPFVPLEPVLAALMTSMRTHPRDAPLLTAAVQCVARLREVALMSTPAGVPHKGEEAIARWRGLLARVAGDAGDFAAAAQALQGALKSTDVAQQRMAGFAIGPAELEGDGFCLSPRMRSAAEVAVKDAMSLSGEVVAASWRREEAERTRKLAATVPAAGKAGSLQAPAPPREAAKEAPEERTAGPETMLPLIGPNGTWKRALGYFEHDEADLNRVWRDPLTDVLTRTFSCPQVAGPGDAGEDALDELLQLHFLQTAPGRLKARCVVRPRTKAHQKVAEQKVRAGAEVVVPDVTAALAKEMRRGGYMLPKYGLQVSVRKGRREDVPGLAAA